MKTPKLIKDLDRKPAKWMTTAEAAEALMLKPASMRSILYGFGDVYGLRPNDKDSHGRLHWDRLEVTKKAMERLGDAQITFQALAGVLDWLGEQRIRTEDGRIAMAYAVVQELEGRY